MKALLSHPRVYLQFQRLVGAERFRRRIVEAYVRPTPGDRVLDIGCGTADILGHMPPIDYVGFDANPRYIDYARKKFAGRGRFYCETVSNERGAYPDTYDIVMAMAILHHLSAEEAHQLLTLGRRALKPGGRLITVDNCFTPGQSPIAKYLISRDRGEFVRTPEGYLELARQVFPDTLLHVHHDGLRIPYSHVVMEMRKPEQ